MLDICDISKKELVRDYVRPWLKKNKKFIFQLANEDLPESWYIYLEQRFKITLKDDCIILKKRKSKKKILFCDE